MKPGAVLVLSIPLLLAACAAREEHAASTSGALLRLEYREQALTLPNLRLDGVQLQETRRLGRSSSVVWHFQEEELGEDHYLPLPDSHEMQDSMHESLSEIFENFGFALRGWPGDPQILIGVEVKQLRLRSLGIGDGTRSCELELEFILREGPASVEITRFSARGESRLDGSWTFLDRSGPRWIPVPGERDPVIEATRDAAIGFLAESLEFWKDPDRWKSSIRLSGAAR